MLKNKLNQLYKPNRILYYKDADEEEIKAFYRGTIDPEILQYANAFGTYDYPGIFFVDSLDKEVIGIEYRSDDPRVDYPDSLKSVVLDENFYYSIEIDNEEPLSLDFIKTLFDEIAHDDDAHRIYSDLVFKENPQCIGVFANGRKTRILY